MKGFPEFCFEDNGIKYYLNIDVFYQDEKPILSIEASFNVPEKNHQSPLEELQRIASKYKVTLYGGSISFGDGEGTSYGITVREEYSLEFHEYKSRFNIREYAERFVATSKNILIELMLRSQQLEKNRIQHQVTAIKSEIENLYEKVKDHPIGADEVLSSVDYAQRVITELEASVKQMPTLKNK